MSVKHVSSVSSNESFTGQKQRPIIELQAQSLPTLENIEFTQPINTCGDLASKQSYYKEAQFDKKDLIKIDNKLSELFNNNDATNKKMAHLSDIIKSMMKSLCNSCGKSRYLINNEHSTNVCNQCNSIICDDCIKSCSCTKCRKKVCEDHCIKCCICNRRSCKDKCCIFDFRICQLCEMTYCQEHFDFHRKYNGTDSNKIKCSMSSYTLNGIQEEKAYKEFLSSLIHCRALKELNLGIWLIKKESF